MSLQVENLFRGSVKSEGQEIVDRLLETNGMRIERIESHGQPSAEGFWFDQPEQEWVALLRGTATLALEDSPLLDLKAGDFLLIPAYCKHRVERTSEDALWLAVHLP
jgi:cupin 2 domain-containing protein